MHRPKIRADFEGGVFRFLSRSARRRIDQRTAPLKVDLVAGARATITAIDALITMNQPSRDASYLSKPQDMEPSRGRKCRLSLAGRVC
jgi:hypothetical protein